MWDVLFHNWALISILGTLVVLIVTPALILRKYVNIVRNILDDTPPPLSRGPNDFDRIEGQAFDFRSFDGHALSGMMVRGDPGSDPRGLIVFAHEYASDAHSFARYCRPLLEAGYDVMTFDFRGHGRSRGEEGYKPRQWASDREQSDMLGAIAWAEDYLEQGGRSRHLGLFGISRGGCAAILAAVDVPSVRAIVTDGAFSTDTTLEYLMKRWATIFAKIRVVAESHPPTFWRFFRWMLLRDCQRQFRCRFPSVRKAVQRLGDTATFFIHGERDSFIHVSQSQLLYDLAKGPKDLWIVPAAKHNQSVIVQPEQYAERTVRFFDQHLAGIRNAECGIRMKDEGRRMKDEDGMPKPQSRIGRIAVSGLVVGLLAGDLPAAPDRGQLRRTPVVEVVEQARDSIVNISATGLVNVQRRDIFDVFFMPEARRQVTSVGSGFVMHEAGYIVTNAHVVDRAIDLRVTFANGTERQAQVVVSDPAHDLAILRIEPTEQLKPIPLGRSDDLMPGETVIAIGNPLGYATTITTGIVSALHRKIEVSADTVYEDLIQTDASINPGSSGGPLLNILGELIGINTAIRPGAENIGFAIPVDQLRALVPYMLDYAIAQGRHIQLGLRVEGTEQPRVVEVEAGSPADQAGIRIGDELLRVDDKPVARDIDFYISMLGRNVGDRVAMELRRGDDVRQVALQLSEIPKPDGAALARARFGMDVENLTPRAARLFGMHGEAGALIMKVEPGGPADRAGCRPGDLLVGMGRRRVNNLDDLGALLDGLQPDTQVSVTFWRVRRDAVYEYSGIRLYSR